MKQSLFIMLMLLYMLINGQSVNGQNTATFYGENAGLEYTKTSDSTVHCTIRELRDWDITDLQDTLKYYKVKSVSSSYSLYWGTRYIQVKIPATVDSIYSNTFNVNSTNWSLHVQIPSDSQIKYIGDRAFYGSDYSAPSQGPSYIGKVLYEYIGDMPEGSSLKIAEGTTQIASYALQRQPISQVTLPKSLLEISNCAFEGCDNLIEITFNDSLKYIGDRAFYFCDSLKRIIIPASVHKIGDEAFNYGYKSVGDMRCHIEEISVDPNNKFYDSRNNCNALIESATNTIIQGSNNTVIPPTVTHIGDYAFQGYAKEHIDIPSSVKSIGEFAFKYSNLESISLPNSVTNIEESAFQQNSNLKHITIPDSIKTIKEYTFCDCESLKSVYLSSSIDTISESAFRGCDIQSLVLPDNIKYIGGCAFSDNTLRTITINRGVDLSSSYDGYSNKATFGSTKDSMSIYCYKRPSEDNMKLSSQAFDMEAMEKGTLYVPCGTELEYRQIEGWNNFVNIIESLEFKVDINTTTGYGYVSVLEPFECGVYDYTIKATPDEGYRFVRWTDGVTDNPRRVTLTQDTAFNAEFAPIMYNLTVRSNDETMGTVSGGGEYKPNSEVTIEAHAYDGYRFIKWTDGITDNPRNITITQDTTFYAEFAPITHKLTVLSNNEKMGTVSGGGEYRPGSIVTIEAQANEGFRFTRWNDNITENPRDITLSQDSTFTAYFEPIDTKVNEISEEGFDVTVQDKTIYVHNSDGNEIQVTDITGRTIYSGYDTTITVRTPGVYIVRCGDHTKKTVVR